MEAQLRVRRVRQGVAELDHAREPPHRVVPEPLPGGVQIHQASWQPTLDASHQPHRRLWSRSVGGGAVRHRGVMEPPLEVGECGLKEV
ncbi:hypothetical protein DAERI_080089 [Deinococcus aerius]|uniref:Uncharacterized protein n=1 Tax=Deinococcus aerius TaxID=200253 RepID=A0A2I9DJ36_9DEIO|nr:hypothetical protein DAERI_080089 [Deinococcus aerius]